MITINDIEKIIISRLNENEDLVHTVCSVPFEFTTIVMKDKDNKHSILFNRLFKFSLKSRYL